MGTPALHGRWWPRRLRPQWPGLCALRWACTPPASPPAPHPPAPPRGLHTGMHRCAGTCLGRAGAGVGRMGGAWHATAKADRVASVGACRRHSTAAAAARLPSSLSHALAQWNTKQAGARKARRLPSRRSTTCSVVPSCGAQSMNTASAAARGVGCGRVPVGCSRRRLGRVQGLHLQRGDLQAGWARQSWQPCTHPTARPAAAWPR